MNLGDMKVDAKLIDETELDEKESDLAKAIFDAYLPAFGAYTLRFPPVAAVQLAIGATLRAVKGNLERGLQVADLSDLAKIKVAEKR